MPKAFDDLVSKVKGSLKGKTNPRTKKPYTDSEVYAIAVSQWKKSHGGKAPSREESPTWYCTDCGEVRENVRLDWAEDFIIEKVKEGEEDKNVTIGGRAVSETISKNKIKYNKKTLDESVNTLIGKPILDSHNATSVKNIIGKVTNATRVVGGIDFIGELDESEEAIVRKVKKGFINKVSIGATAKKLIKKKTEEDGEFFVAEGLNFEELSLVPVPGIDSATMTLMNAVTESFNMELENNKEDICMAEEKTNENVKGLLNKIDSLQEKLSEMEKLNSSLTEKSNKAEEKIKEHEHEKKIKLVKEVHEAMKKAGLAKEDEASRLESLSEETLNLLMEKAKMVKVKEEEPEEEKMDDSKEVEEPAEDEESTEPEESSEDFIVEKSKDGTSFYALPKYESVFEGVKFR